MRKKINHIYVVLFLAILIPLGYAAADYNPEKWQFFKDIAIEATEDDVVSPNQLVKVTLDQDVFNGSEESLRDLRVVNNSGEEVPYKIIVERGNFSERNIYPVKILNNSFVPGQDNLFVVDFGQGGFLNSSLRILTASENFRRQVEVSGSNDMQDWRVLKTDGYIYDYTDKQGNFKAQSATINYPENAYRYLQVRIFLGGEAPLKVTGAQVSKITNNVAVATKFSPIYQTQQNTERKVTEVVIDLEKKGRPTNNILVDSPAKNFNREVAIYESDDKNNWRVLGQDYIFNYDTPKFKGASLSVKYPESNSRYLKLDIYNGDNQPIVISGLSIESVLRDVVFQYVPGINYRLYYGNDKAKFPEYDLNSFFAYLNTENYATGKLAANEQANSLFKAEVQPLPPLSERMPYLLPASLIIVVLVLGYFVFSFVKQVKK